MNRKTLPTPNCRNTDLLCTESTPADTVIHDRTKRNNATPFLGKMAFFVFALFLLLPGKMMATHFAGGEITYRYISGTNYEVCLRLYRDCAGVNFFNPERVSITPAGFGQNTLLLPQVSVQEISPICPQAASTCSGGSLNGVEERVFKATRSFPTLPQGQTYTLSHDRCCRNFAINTLVSPGGTGWYITTELDPNQNPRNSSPAFLNPPVAFLCVNQPATINPLASDPDGDALTYSLIPCRDNTASFPNVTYATGFSSTSPLTTATGVALNPVTGQITFTPTQLDIGVICVKVEEFRNGVKIGEVVRDIQIQVQACQNNNPVITPISNQIAAVGNQLCVPVTVTDIDGDNLTVNVSSSIQPPAVFIITSSSPGLVTGLFCWTPAPGDAGNSFPISINALDDACPLSGQASESFNITVPTPCALNFSSNILNETCVGSSNGAIDVTVVGATPPISYNWFGPNSFTAITEDITGLGGGSYTLVVVDGNNCVDSMAFTVNQGAIAINFNVNPIDPDCGGGGGTIEINGESGGVPPYTYSIDGGVTTQNSNIFTGLGPGVYDVRVFDNSGCASAIQPITLTQIGADPIVIVCPGDSTIGTGASCEAQTPDFIPLVTLTGGCPPLIIEQFPVAGSAVETGITPIVITVRDGINVVDSCTLNLIVFDSVAPNLSGVPNDTTVSCSDVPEAATVVATDNCPNPILQFNESIAFGNCSGNYVLTRVWTTFQESIAIRDTQIVTVVDTASPIIVCPANSTVNNDLGLCGAAVTHNANATDNCGSPTITYSPADGSVLPVGVNTITASADDGCGNTTDCQFTVTVNDTEAPTPLCQDITITTTSNTGPTLVTPAQIDNGSTDNCGIVSTLVTPNAFLCINAGLNQVQLILQDAAGNTDSCTANVTVIDNCCDLILTLDNSNDPACPGASDGNIDISSTTSNLPVTYSWSNGATSEDLTGVVQGIYTVIATDGNNCMDTLTVTLTDTPDNTPPTANCNDVTIQVDGAGNASTTIAALDGGATDNCSTPTIATNVLDFDCADVGANIVVITATDAAGNTDTCQAIVTVQDTIPPTVSCQDLTVNLDGAGTASITAADVTGAGGGSGTAVVTIEIITDFFGSETSWEFRDNGGSIIASVAPGAYPDFAPGTFTQDITVPCGSDYTFTIFDSFSNGGAEYNVYVNGGTAVISAVMVGGTEGPFTVSIPTCGGGSGIADNCAIGTSGIDITNFTCADVPGPVTVTLTATDVNGNSASCTAAVTVQDTLPPVALCQDITITTTDPVNPVVVTAGQIDNNSTDNCGIVSQDLNPSGFTCADAGANTVTLTVTDAAGNASTCTATVTVVDNCCDLLLTNTGSTNPSCPGASDGSIDVTTTTSAGPVTYLWSNGATTEDLSGVVQGVYTLIATEGPNCSDTLTVTLTDTPDNTPPTANCNDVTIQVDGAGNASTTIAALDGGATDNCSTPTVATNVLDFDCADVGANIVVITATDAAGNTDTCQAIVTVQDTIPPTVSCQDLTVNLDGSGNASITAADVTGSGGGSGTAVVTIEIITDFFGSETSWEFRDNGGSIIASVAPGAYPDFAPGTFTQDITVPCGSDYTFTIFDSFSNGGAGYNVSINGATPVISAVMVGGTEGPFTVSIPTCGGGSGIADNCAIGTSGIDITTFTCADVPGPVTVTLTATDVNGNSASCTAAVTVQDTLPPVALCQDITITTTDPVNPVVVTAGQIDNNSTDNCGIVSQDLNPSGFTCADAGANTVTLTVTDAAGNASTCTATVTVVDNCCDLMLSNAGSSDPSCPGTTDGSIDITTTTSNGPVTYLWSNGATTEDLSGVGAGTYTLVATEGPGCSDSITVTLVNSPDTIAPVIACPADITQDNDPGLCSAVVTYAVPTASDNCPVAGPTPVNTLVAGDLAFTAVKCDNPDEFRFVILTPILSGTVISFTDNGWLASNAFRAGEGMIEWTASSNLSEGTEVIITNNNAANTGTVNVVNVMSLSSSGDQIFAFQGSLAAPTLIAGIHFDSPTWQANAGTAGQSAEPAALAGGFAVAIPELDNIFYNCAVITGTPSVILAGIHTPANWAGGNASTDYTPTACAFSVQAGGGLAPVLISGIGSGGIFPVGTSDEIWEVTDGAGNTARCTLQVTVNDVEPPVALCQDITITATSTTVPVTITAADINNTSTDNCGILSVEVAPAGFTCNDAGANTVTLTVTDVNNNVSTCTATVTVVDNCCDLQLALTNSSDPTCSGFSDGSIDITATTALGPVTYLWSNGATTEDLSGVAAGTYTVTVTVTGVAGCTETLDVTLTDPPVLSASGVGTNPQCAGDANGSIDLTVIGGTPGYSYLWSNGATTEDIGGLAAGVYSVTVTDNNGCTATADVTLTDPAALTLNAVPTHPLCSNAGTGSVDLTVTGGTAPYSYLWTMPPMPGTFATTEDLSSLNGGTFDVTVTDNNGCSASTTVTVIEPAPITGTTVDMNPICPGDANGSIDLTPAGGTAPYTYLWSNGATTEDLSGVAAGTYTVTITDVNNCTGTASATLADGVDTTPPVANCNDVTVQLDANGDGATTVAAVDGGATDNCSTPTVTANPLDFDCSHVGANIVVVTATDAAGNTDTCQAIVTVMDTIPPTVSCQDLTVNLDGAGLASITAADVFGAGGGSGTAVVTIEIITDFFGSETSWEFRDNGGSLIASVPPGTYPDFAPGTFTQDITVPCGSDYIFTIFDSFSNGGAAYNVRIDGGAPAISGLMAGAQDGPTTLSIPACGGGGGIADNCGIGNFGIDITNFTCADVPGPNTVTLTVTDVNGNTSNCTSAVTVQDTLPPVALCQDITITTTDPVNPQVVTGGQIDNNSTDNCGIVSLDVNPSGFTCSDAGANTVTLTVTDAAGNVSTCTATVTVVDNCCDLLLSLNNSTDPSCPGSSDGSIDVTTTTSNGPVTYLWSNGATTEDLTGLTQGTYTLIATEGPGCSDTLEVTITDTPDDTDPVLVGVPADVTVECDAIPGAPTVTATDNCTAPVVVTLNEDSTAGSCPSNYTLTRTWTADDGNGNIATGVQVITVEDNTAPVVVCPADIVQDNDPGVCEAAVTFAANATDNCGTPTISYSAASGSSFPVGTSTVTATADDGCGNTATCDFNITINDTEAPTIACPADITQDNDAGLCSAVVTYPAPTVSDNCPVAGPTPVSTLAAGDLAFTAVKCDNPDEFRFVLLTPILSGTVISFTDKGWLNTNAFRAGEGEIQWTAPANLAEGTEVIISSNNSANIGTVNVIAVMSLASSGDQLFAFQGTVASPTLIAGLHFDSPTWQVNATNDGNSSEPSALSGGFAVAIPELDNIYYNCAVITGTPSVIRAGIYTPANWGGGNAATVYLPVACGFSVQAGAGLAPVLISGIGSGGTFPVGTSEEVWEVTDGVGNAARCTLQVTVNDVEPPVALCQDITITTTSTTVPVTITAADINNNSTDNCGIATVEVAPAGFTCNDAGANTVTLTVTDVNGNVSTCTATVTVIDNCCDLILTLNGSTDPSCSGFSDGSIDITATTALGPITYLWSNGATTEDLSGVPAGTYSVTATVTAGCTETLSVTLTDPPVLSASGVGTNPLCAGDANGSIDLTVIGGTPGYSFLWSNGATTEDIGGLAAGTYSVTVTDNNGCTATADVTLTEPVVLTASAAGTDPLCAGDANGSIDLTVTGGTPAYSYLWSNGATTEDVSGLAAGTYSVTITDNNGCSTTASATLTDPAPVVATAAGTDPLCAGDANGSIDLTVSGGTTPYTYVWSNSATSEDLSGLTAGTYSVTVTDANGCTASASATLTDPATLSASAAGTDPACAGESTGSVDLTVTGGTAPYTYAWSNTATTEDLASVAAGTYTVTVTDANGCTATASATLVDPLAISASAVGTNPACAGESTGSVDLTVSGGTPGYSYLWSNGATTEDLSGVAAGTYTVTITDNNGCSATASATLTDPAALTASAAGTDPACAGDASGSVDLTVTGGTAPYTYAWSNSATTEDLSNVTAGTYMVTVTDANNCTATASATLTDPAAIVASAVGTDPVCPGDGNGSIDLTVSGGTAPYTYLWSNGATTEDLSGLSAGTYSVTITDANNCTATTSVTLVNGVDNVPPVAACTDVTVQLDANGDVSIVVGDVDGGATDNCTVASITATPLTFDCSNVGANTVVVTATDNSGNTDTCQAIVTVMDTIPPTVSCQDATVYLDGAGPGFNH